MSRGFNIIKFIQKYCHVAAVIAAPRADEVKSRGLDLAAAETALGGYLAATENLATAFARLPTFEAGNVATAANPGRRSTYRRGKSVQTTGTTSV